MVQPHVSCRESAITKSAKDRLTGIWADWVASAQPGNKFFGDKISELRRTGQVTIARLLTVNHDSHHGRDLSFANQVVENSRNWNSLRKRFAVEQHEQPI